MRRNRGISLLAAMTVALTLPTGGASATEAGNADQAYDFRLINQEGRPVRLSDLRGKAVLVSYIFTRCPMPTMCPLVTSKMKQVQAAVNGTLKDRVVLVSISFDPAYDTPEVLKEYGERYGADFSNWQFLTGDAAEIQAAAQDANVIYEDMGEGNFTHNMNTVLVAPDGTVRQRFHGSGWKVHEVMEGIQEVVR
ncbi:MAG: SCO family protein [Candidatus Omnitrophica bacterium]|nr:SCO family protein [Candidatus Omnitrophota bacterium]